MYLEELITQLEKHDRSQIVKHGFHWPHSYRGDYSKLAFQPVANTRVGEMLDEAKSALGAHYEGYKGGDYRMDGYTECYLANWGECGEEIGPTLLKFMLGEIDNT